MGTILSTIRAMLAKARDKPPLKTGWRWELGEKGDSAQKLYFEWEKSEERTI